MLKRDELAKPTSCLNSALSDEPIFVLRANDDLASDVVREWAARYLQAKGNAMTDRQRAKYYDAIQLAEKMDDWRSSNG